jgi:hypothetical protein
MLARNLLLYSSGVLLFVMATRPGGPLVVRYILQASTEHYCDCQPVDIPLCIRYATLGTGEVDFYPACGIAPWSTRKAFR